LRNQDGKLAASEEARGIAGQGDEVGLGEAADQALLFERIDGDVDRERSRKAARGLRRDAQGAHERALVIESRHLTSAE